MNELWILSVLLVGLSNLSHAQQSFGECITVSNQRGSCIRLRECGTPYDDIWQNPQLMANFISVSTCGYLPSEQTVLVCCALPIASTIPWKSIRSVTSESLLPVAPICGKHLNIGPGIKIMGGENADPKEFPWMALLEYVSMDNTRSHLCGGSLINNQYVVTAAHCIEIPMRLIGVRLGEWDISTTTDCYTRLNNYKVCNPAHIDVPISEIIVHEQYSRRELNHDIALLRLQYPVTYSDFISPICLPINANQRNKTYTRRQMVVAGWGITSDGTPANIKQKIDTFTIDSSYCSQRYMAYGSLMSNKQICAGGDEAAGACNGDSGGPLIVLDEANNYYLAGVVSYGSKPCGIGGMPTVYTRVGEYMDWILSHIKP